MENINNNTIALLGLGRLGLTFGLLCDEVGLEVHGFEINQERTEQIRNKTLKTPEPQIEKLLKKSNLILHDSLKETIDSSDLIFVFVATPSNPDGSYNHSQVDGVVDEIISIYKEPINKTLVINCTVLPKYCDTIQEKLNHLGIRVIYSPEFIAQGSIVKDYKNADIVLIGGNPPQKLLNVYKSIMDIEPNFKVLSLLGAELTKISINCYLTLKIVYANYIGGLAIESGEEESVKNILLTIGSDSRIGNKYLGYGFPSGGICLSRDVRALKYYSTVVNVDNRFVSELIVENNRHLSYLKQYYLKQNPDKSVPFIFSYISYKPNLDIIVESKQLELCLELLKEGYTVYVENSENISLPQELLSYGNKVIFDTTNNGYRVN